GLDLRTLDDVVRRLSEVGLIDQETLQPLAWDKRQMKSDSSAERVARFRARKKQEQDGNEGSNASVTLPKRPGNALDKEADKEGDTDTDTEKDKEKINVRRKAPALEFSAWPAEPRAEVIADYLRHRREIKAPLTQTALNRLGTEAHRALEMGYSVDDFLAECMLRGWRGGKASWLERRNEPRAGQASGFDPLAYVNRHRQREEIDDVIDI